MYRSVADNPYVQSALALPGVQEFLWFARFPVFTYLERDGRSVVQISDARFIGPRRPGLVASTSTPLSNFTYEVVFAADGNVVSAGPLDIQ